MNGAHPLIARLAERVMNVNLRTITPTGNPVLRSEPEWEDESTSRFQQQAGSSASSGGAGYGQRLNGNGEDGGNPSGGTTTPSDKQLMDVPSSLFYPFYPEAHAVRTASEAAAGNGVEGFTQILAQAATGGVGSYGCQPSHDSYMSEERDIAHTMHTHSQVQPIQQGAGTATAQAQGGAAQSQAAPPISMWMNAVNHG